MPVDRHTPKKMEPPMTSNSALGFTQSSALSTQYSVSPNGEQFPLPSPQDEAAEILRLQALVAEHRAQGHEIVAASKIALLGASYRDDVYELKIAA